MSIFKEAKLAPGLACPHANFIFQIPSISFDINSIFIIFTILSKREENKLLA
jgi:hypothetical protein